MKLQALSSYRYRAYMAMTQYMEITDLPCFCKVKSALSHQNTIGNYIFIDGNEEYYYGFNSIHLGAWDADNNFYIFINGRLHHTQQKYFEVLSTKPESTLKWRLSL